MNPKGWLLAGVLCGCASPNPPPSKEPAPSEATHRETSTDQRPVHAALGDYIVSPGIRWLVSLRPEAIVAKLPRAPGSWLSSERLAGLSRSLGVRVAQAPEAVIAGYDYSTLYLARVPLGHSSETLEALVRYRARLSEVPVTQPIGALTLYSGIHDGLPEHFLRLDDRTIAWSGGDPSTIKAAGLLTQGRLTVSSALAGPSLSLLPEKCRRGDLVAFLPGPLDEHQLGGDAEASGVLSLILAAALRVTLRDEHVEVTGCVVGDWHADGRARVDALLEQLMNHRFMSLLELTDEQKRFVSSQSGDLVEFTYRWPLEPLLKRVEAVLELRLE